MRICAAQIRPSTGDIEANVRKHRLLIDLAVHHDAHLIFFPELSLTGYEPKLARQLATSQDDARLDPFQSIADEKSLVIGVGLPTTDASDIRISMVVFQPKRARLTYSKQLLHADERSYFVNGGEQLVFEGSGHWVAPAICYESLQDAHADDAARLGADIYLASVAKPERNVTRAYTHYPAIAQRHGMTVLMANCLGPCDDFVAVGRSAVWNSRGELKGKLDDEREGIVMIDTLTHEVGVAYGSTPSVRAGVVDGRGHRQQIGPGTG